jgi:hypothetical protein
MKKQKLHPHLTKRILRQAQDKQSKISEEFPGGHTKLREIFVPLKSEISLVEKTGIFI